MTRKEFEEWLDSNNFRTVFNTDGIPFNYIGETMKTEIAHSEDGSYGTYECIEVDSKWRVNSELKIVGDKPSQNYLFYSRELFETEEQALEWLKNRILMYYESHLVLKKDDELIKLMYQTSDSIPKYNIVTKGGSMCFYGEWFGKPYDNFHHIIKANYEKDCLNIYFDKGKILSVFNPMEITNEEHCFIIKKASKVIWQYIPYGNTSNNIKKYIYKDCGNGKIIKIISDNEEIICPKENIAVQCLSY